MDRGAKNNKTSVNENQIWKKDGRVAEPKLYWFKIYFINFFLQNYVLMDQLV